MEKKGLQVIKDVASKTAGLVFFSVLAISLGVVFGVMFDRFFGVGQETGTPTAANGVEQPYEDVAAQPETPTGEVPSVTGDSSAPAPAAATVKYRVKVGPYTDLAQATKAADELRSQGYPIFMGKQSPFLIQVGAFANKDNALSLKEVLTQKGYTVAVDPQ